MPAGTKYPKDLNLSLRSIRTPAIYDSNLDEWLMLSANVIKTEGGLFIFQKGTDDGRTKVDAQLTGRKVGEVATLQDAVSAVGNGNSIYMESNDTFKITEISGTSTSRTLIFEVCDTENGTYSLIQGMRLLDSALETQTSNKYEIWVFEGVAGLWFRCRVSAVAGGNVTVKGKVVA